jgi:hypothetical protein
VIERRIGGMTTVEVSSAPDATRRSTNADVTATIRRVGAMIP